MSQMQFGPNFPQMMSMFGTVANVGLGVLNNAVGLGDHHLHHHPLIIRPGLWARSDANSIT